MLLARNDDTRAFPLDPNDARVRLGAEVDSRRRNVTALTDRARAA